MGFLYDLQRGLERAGRGEVADPQVTRLVDQPAKRAYVYSEPIPFGGGDAASICSVHGEFHQGGSLRWAEAQPCPACAKGCGR